MSGCQDDRSDVRRVVECQEANRLEDVLKHGGGVEEAESAPAWSPRPGWKSSQASWLGGETVYKKYEVIPKSNREDSNMSVACLSKLSAARLKDMNKHEEMCTVDVIGQRETQKYVCTVCMEPSVQCVQCVRADAAGVM